MFFLKILKPFVRSFLCRGLYICKFSKPSLSNFPSGFMHRWKEWQRARKNEKEEVKSFASVPHFYWKYRIYYYIYHGIYAHHIIGNPSFSIECIIEYKFSWSLICGFAIYRIIALIIPYEYSILINGLQLQWGLNYVRTTVQFRLILQKVLLVLN